MKNVIQCFRQRSIVLNKTVKNQASVSVCI